MIKTCNIAILLPGADEVLDFNKNKGDKPFRGASGMLLDCLLTSPGFECAAEDA